MGFKQVKFDLISYGKKWLLIAIPLVFSFATNFWVKCPPHEKPFFVTTLESIYLSLSSAGIFHLFIVHFPERKKTRNALIPLNFHVQWCDRNFLFFLKMIDDSLKQIEDLENKSHSFFRNLENFDLEQIRFDQYNDGQATMIYYGPFRKLFLDSIVRVTNIKEIFLANPQEFESEDLLTISRIIRSRKTLRRDDLSNEDQKKAFGNLVESYILLRKKIGKLSLNHGV